MIIEHQIGDITSPKNKRDIIIGMNTKLNEVNGIGKPFVEEKFLQDGTLELGSVLTFKYGEGRRLHMLICHQLGVGGWKNTSEYIRFGLDHLWYHGRDRRYSIVTIGEGRIGKRDGADIAKINNAIATSHLKMTQFILGDERTSLAVALQKIPTMYEHVWQPSSGYRPPIQVAA